jgi:hypothetical protein
MLLTSERVRVGGICVLDHNSVIHDYTAICGLREALRDLSGLLLGCGLLLSASTTLSRSISIAVSLWESRGEGEKDGEGEDGGMHLDDGFLGRRERDYRILELIIENWTSR